MIKEITSLKNDLVKYANNLKETKYIKENNEFLIEGEHLIELAKDSLEAVFLKEARSDLDEKIAQYIVPDSILDKLSSGKSSARIIGICKINPKTLDDSDFVVYLDNIQDPGNVGTILRTCLGLNIKNVILSFDCAYHYSSKVIQASQGAIFNLNVINGDCNLLKKLQKSGFNLIGTVLDDDSVKLKNLKITEKTCIIFGNEGQGIRKEIINMLDEKVIIPIQNIDSFNVGVAAGITLYSILNK